MTDPLAAIAPFPIQTETQSSRFDSFRRQAYVWLLLSMLAMAALITVHMAFVQVMGYPSVGLLILFAARFIEQIGELAWLQNYKGHFSEKAKLKYAAFSVVTGVAFAFAASMLSNVQESHYAALMVLPIIVAAASELSLAYTVSTVAVCAFLTIFQVWYYYERRPQLTEYYEASTVALIYVVVALVVHLLVDILRQREASLEHTIDELAVTRDKLVNEEKLAAVGRLASSIAHEIRNPVSVISSSLETALSETSGTQSRKMMLSIAREEAKRMEVLTTDFLSYARQQQPDKKETQILTALEYVRDVVQGRAADLAVSVVVKVEKDHSVICDPYQIYQALINLTINAIEASDRNCVVTLTGGVRDDMAVLGVENSGEAIPASSIERLFEPFFTTKPQGTGLGLAISHKIASAHGGNLRLAVNNPELIRFELTLPLE
ncbi:MAG: hypothetical protein KDB65_08140 [Calditrichaeota bacterium]|nr:hypothetical protein [Calditrichota bacterium]MCB9369880.1 hypothetical protein [Calditrichota bacterium]